MSPISVMVIDDSAVVRQVMTEMIGKAPGLRLLGVASDPLYALEKMEREWPDVIVLDVEMPRMDGITFLRKVMDEHPTPVVICSTLTEKGADTTMQAMSAGAVEIIVKPKLALKKFLEESAAELINAIKAAAQAKVGRVRPGRESPIKIPPKFTADAVIPAATAQAMAQTTERIVAIGTSTGGTQALEAVLTALPRVAPGIVVVQHMPEKFTEAFAMRLNKICAIEVREAKANDRVIPGLCLIAPGGRHTLLKRSGAYYFVDVVDGPAVSRHKPSVDVLFRSAAKAAGRNALGIIMTGMGDDGAQGLKEMFDAGAQTLAQDEASCVVYGMPKEAVKRGAVSRSVPLSGIAAEICRER
jgi:two-component system chemotaxis response regulator CheB